MQNIKQCHFYYHKNHPSLIYEEINEIEMAFAIATKCCRKSPYLLSYNICKYQFLTS